MSGQFVTRQDAEAFVARCLGEYAVEHDVPAIAESCRELVGSWDVRQVDTEDFWALVRHYALDGAGQEVSSPHDGETRDLSNIAHLSTPSSPHDGEALPVRRLPTRDGLPVQANADRYRDRTGYRLAGQHQDSAR